MKVVEALPARPVPTYDGAAASQAPGAAHSYSSMVEFGGNPVILTRNGCPPVRAVSGVTVMAGAALGEGVVFSWAAERWLAVPQPTASSTKPAASIARVPVAVAAPLCDISL